MTIHWRRHLPRILGGILLVSFFTCSTVLAANENKPAWSHNEASTLVSLQELRTILLRLEKLMGDVNRGGVESFTLIKHYVFDYEQIRRSLKFRHPDNTNIMGLLQDYDAIAEIGTQIARNEKEIKALKQFLSDFYRGIGIISDGISIVNGHLTPGTTETEIWILTNRLLLSTKSVRELVQLLLVDRNNLQDTVHRLHQHLNNLQDSAQALSEKVKKQASFKALLEIKQESEKMKKAVDDVEKPIQTYFEVRAAVNRAAEKTPLIRSQTKFMVNDYLLRQTID